MTSPEKSLGGKKKASKPKSKNKSHKPAKKKPRHIHIELHDDGSATARHQFDQGGPEDEPIPDQSHGLGDPSQLLAHIQDTNGGTLPTQNSAGPEAAGPGAAAAPAQGMQV